MCHTSTLAQDFLSEVRQRSYGTILADPPWQFSNRTGKMAPEHRRLSRYPTLTLQAIKAIPVAAVAAAQSHLYLWVPNALLREGLEVMEAWGFQYKTNLIWHKIRKDGGPDGRGVGFYFRNTTEMVLFGVRGQLRTLTSGRTQVNIIKTQKREHSRKPDELYAIIEACSPGPFLSSSHVVSEPTGINGATKWWTTHRHGRRMPTIASIGRGSEHEDGYLDH